MPTEVDVARCMIRWADDDEVKSVADGADAGGFPHANLVAMAQAAKDAGDASHRGNRSPGTADFAPLIEKLNGWRADVLLTAGRLHGWLL